MPIADPTPMRAAIEMLEIRVETLWVDYVGLGGILPLAEIVEFIDGHSALLDADYDRLAQALNELFMDRGEDHPLLYADEVGRPRDP